MSGIKALIAAREALIGHGAECKDVNDALALIDAALAAPVQEPVAWRQTGWAAHRDQYAVPVLFNPYTGQPRDVRDVQSDPQGILIVPPGKVEMLAAKPTVKESLQVATSPAAPVQEPVAVHQFRSPHCSDWYDGIPDHHDGHGPYEVRTLYTAPACTRIKEAP